MLLAASTTSLPPRASPCAVRRSSSAPAGTASTTVSARAIASAMPAVVAPLSPAAASDAGVREPRMVGCPARAKARPSVPPMNPVPMTATVMMLSPQGSGSGADGGEDGLGDLAAGVLLLARDQATVADGEGLEQARADVAGAAFAQRVLQAPGHDLHAGGAVAVVFFDVGEAGDGAAGDQCGAVGQVAVDQRGDPVAVGGYGLLDVPERADRLVEVLVVAEGEHGRLAAGDHQRLEAGQVQAVERRGVLQQCGKFGGG